MPQNECGTQISHTQVCLPSIMGIFVAYGGTLALQLHIEKRPTTLLDANITLLMDNVLSILLNYNNMFINQ